MGLALGDDPSATHDIQTDHHRSGPGGGLLALGSPRSSRLVEPKVSLQGGAEVGLNGGDGR